MAYRSDVRIVVSKKGYQELSLYVNKYLKEHHGEIYENLLNKCTIKKGKYFYYLKWNSIKFYEWNNEIQAIYEGLEHLKTSDYSYRIAVLGENLDDYSERYFESSKEREQDLPYPSLIRKFDDCEVEQCLNPSKVNNFLESR